MKTVTVRIPVAVFSDGSFNSPEGTSFQSAEPLLRRLAVDSKAYGFEGACNVVWITAEVPVPEQTEVQGRVE